ncbi:MAG: MoaD/ThiS family protein [Anaerolineae bacterium]|jgi:sulfur carrier protein ThiS|nr:MoaD/ThiS family protein [Anaerolineae bacterium]MBT4312292.1 MoaD/ThiS family protein [Anaerolineae bacterium]MBT4458793.1 MoaD/ThiS family protein [Anaerolineae bacterium]MBT4841250.1 MoaD/ThiS family protein [Anaerolineae bacterium]MBT6322915.1 MoaD/ThiS family protein [Anaerolineae bacterium]
MKISVKLIATYRELLPPGAQGNKIEIDVPEGTTASDVMTQFNVPQDETSVIVVNGLTVPLSTILVEGDEVTAFSAIAGG